RLAPLHLPGPLDRKGLEASLPPLAPDLPRSAVTPSAPPARPRPLPEEPPLVRSFFDPLMPQALTLPAGAGVRLPSLALDRPPPLPILAQPQPDRASLEGPTAAFSVGAALAAPLPERSTPAPFIRLVIPDPFEHHQALRGKTPPPEERVPPIAAPLPDR